VRASGQNVLKVFGRLDILTNNAAFQQHADPLEDITDAQLMQTLHTNIGGDLHLARTVLPHLERGRHRRRLRNRSVRQPEAARLCVDQRHHPRFNPFAPATCLSAASASTRWRDFAQRFAPASLRNPFRTALPFALRVTV